MPFDPEFVKGWLDDANLLWMRWTVASSKKSIKIDLPKLWKQPWRLPSKKTKRRVQVLQLCMVAQMLRNTTKIFCAHLAAPSCPFTVFDFCLASIGPKMNIQVSLLYFLWGVVFLVKSWSKTSTFRRCENKCLKSFPVCWFLSGCNTGTNLNFAHLTFELRKKLLHLLLYVEG